MPANRGTPMRLLAPASLAWVPLVHAAAPQSALHPAGAGAEQIAELFWWMAAGAAIVWVLVVGLAVYATRRHPAKYSDRTAHLLIVLGGAVVPTLVLAVLLVASLPLLPELRKPGDADLRIEVSGKQWWWRVRYLHENGAPVELANEVHLPLGKRVELVLSSPDVIHSFWVPALGGKMDMIPGRTNSLILEPTRIGVFRGVCAEYCGASHALMRFTAVVSDQDTFARWLSAQAAPATDPDGELAQRGKAAFLANGCGSCHAIRGTEADGRVGPDLTHVGGRLTLAAGVLPNTTFAFKQWIGHTTTIKPDARMPAFGMLPQDDLDAMAAYLAGLR